MRPRAALFAAAIAVGACAARPSPRLLWIAADFDQFEPFSLPDELQPDSTTPGDVAHWFVAAGGADDSPRCLSVDAPGSAGQQFHLLLTSVPFATRDLELSVRIRADGGQEDRGGGLVWRAASARDYYVARWNPLEDNVRLYRVVDGDRQQLRSADVTVPADAAPWHELRVAVQGAHMTVLFDGREMFTARDDTFAGVGKVGLWSKADASTSFDDLRVRRLD